MKQTLVIILTIASLQSSAQAWNAQQCMQYAVEHNHEVKRAALELDNHKAAKTAAIGRFLPTVDASVGGQYNFGRAIDPETNGYTDVSTFYNGYSLQVSLPVFDGFSRIHALRTAKAGMLMGCAALRQEQDQTALNVLQAYTNVAYYERLVEMAGEKVQEMLLLLSQVRLLEEVGRRSCADVAQVESQKAEADYELIRQQNLLASSMLELKKEMGFPLSEELSVKSEEFATAIPVSSLHSLSSKDSSLLTLNSSLQMARYQMQASKHEWHQARAALFPSLSLSAGLNTTYYHTLHSSSAQAFHTQFKNNMGEFVGASLTIPLFNRLQTITGIRRAKNNYRMACENYEQKRLELEKLSREAWQDWRGYLKQTEQMAKKVKADSIAYQLTRRQFEEGLATAVDLRTTSSQLLNSKATLLQCQLMAMVKKYLVRYYRGESIWE